MLVIKQSPYSKRGRASLPVCLKNKDFVFSLRVVVCKNLKNKKDLVVHAQRTLIVSRYVTCFTQLIFKDIIR